VIVLDTHAWVWWVAGDPRLSAAARTAIERAMGESKLRVSAISAWEVAVLVRRGRLELTMGVEDWVARCEALPFVRFVPVDHRIALKSVALEGLHEDPADRIIVATALSLGAALVTRDQRLWAYADLETLW
jgi:PIN domain nuclease of toxin-antitoxin system